jgi:hypothetical protein
MSIDPPPPTAENPPEQFAGDDPAGTTTWKERITDAEYQGDGPTGVPA